MKETFKTVILILLGASALYLTWRTWVADSAALFGIDTAEHEEYAPARPDVAPSSATPVKCAVMRNGIRSGAQYDAETAAVYEMFKPLLTESFRLAEPAIPIGVSDLQDVMDRDSVYFEFSGQYPLSLLAAWLSADSPGDAEVWAIGLVFDDTGRVDLLWLDTDGTANIARTYAVQSEFPNLPYLRPCAFAFEAEYAGRLHPLQILLEESMRHDIAISAAPDPDDPVYVPFLENLELFPQSTQWYMQGGTRVYVDAEARRSCEISSDGLIVFISPAEIAFNRATVPPADTSNIAANVLRAWEALSLLQPAMGAARYEVCRITPSGTGFSIEFNLTAGGVPLLLEPAVVETEGFSVRKISLQLYHVEMLQMQPILLPLRQAATLAQRDGGTRLDMRYIPGTDNIARIDWAVRK